MKRLLQHFSEKRKTNRANLGTAPGVDVLLQAFCIQLRLSAKHGIRNFFLGKRGHRTSKPMQRERGIMIRFQGTPYHLYLVVEVNMNLNHTDQPTPHSQDSRTRASHVTIT